MNYQVAASLLLQLFGINKFLDRLLHVPKEALPTAAALAGVTTDQWRQVEATQKMIVKTGILLKVPPGEL